MVSGLHTTGLQRCPDCTSLLVNLSPWDKHWAVWRNRLTDETNPSGPPSRLL